MSCREGMTVGGAGGPADVCFKRTGGGGLKNIEGMDELSCGSGDFGLSSLVSGCGIDASSSSNDGGGDPLSREALQLNSQSNNAIWSKPSSSSNDDLSSVFWGKRVGVLSARSPKPRSAQCQLSIVSGWKVTVFLNGVSDAKRVRFREEP